MAGYNQGILVLETRLGPGYDEYSKKQKQELLETFINDCDNDTGSCVILGGKLRKTKRKFRSRKNRRIKKTRRRRGKK